VHHPDDVDKDSLQNSGYCFHLYRIHYLRRIIFIKLRESFRSCLGDITRMLTFFCLIFYFPEVMDALHKMINPKTKMPSPVISDYHHSVIMKHADRLNSAIIYDRDFSYNYFGFKVGCA